MDGFELETESPEDNRNLGVVSPRTRVNRVRGVLVNGEQRYLLVQNNAGRRENVGKWSLPGGRLKTREEPKSALRRELHEELAIWVPRLRQLGEWIRMGECHRIYGCEVGDLALTPQPEEILASAWLTYEDVVELAADRRLRWGFELAAINLFRRSAH